MTVLDLFLLGLVLLSAGIGLWRGLLTEVLSLLIWALAFWVAYRFGNWAAQFLQFIESLQLRAIVSYVGLFIVVLSLGALLVWGIRKLMQESGLSGTDRTLGFVFGLFRGVLICVAIVVLMAFTPMQREPFWQDSTTVPVLLETADWIKSLLPDASSEENIDSLIKPLTSPDESNNGAEQVSN